MLSNCLDLEAVVFEFWVGFEMEMWDCLRKRDDLERILHNHIFP